MKKRPADSNWEASLRFRLDDFRSTVVPVDGAPWSLKVRCTGWRFDRETEPKAFAEIDGWLRSHPSLKAWLMDHSTGPEILCYLRDADGRQQSNPFVLELLSVLLRQARQLRELKMAKHGKVEIVLRGFDAAGRYVERIVSSGPVGSAELEVSNLLEKFEARGVVFRMKMREPVAAPLDGDD